MKVINAVISRISGAVSWTAGAVKRFPVDKIRDFFKATFYYLGKLGWIIVQFWGACLLLWVLGEVFPQLKEVMPSVYQAVDFGLLLFNFIVWLGWQIAGWILFPIYRIVTFFLDGWKSVIGAIGNRWFM